MKLNHFCLKMNQIQTYEPAERQHNHVTIFSGVPTVTVFEACYYVFSQVETRLCVGAC